MKVKTHIVFGILLAFFILDFRGVNSWIFYFIGAFLGAILPDIDHPNSYFNNKVPKFLKPIFQILSRTLKHRGIMHSFFPIIAIYAIYVLTGQPSFVFGILIGYASHLLIDGLTIQGTNFLNPIATLRLSGFIETGDTAELFLLFMMLLVLVFKVINFFFNLF